MHLPFREPKPHGSRERYCGVCGVSVWRECGLGASRWKTPLKTTLLTLIIADSASTPNEGNQLIFKNLPLSWWVSGLNSGNIQYRHVSNYVNWAFVNLDEKDVNISKEITDFIIPNRTKSMTRDLVTNITTVIMEDNKCLVLSKTMKMPF